MFIKAANYLNLNCGRAKFLFCFGYLKLFCTSLYLFGSDFRTKTLFGQALLFARNCLLLLAFGERNFRWEFCVLLVVGDKCFALGNRGVGPLDSTVIFALAKILNVFPQHSPAEAKLIYHV